MYHEECFRCQECHAPISGTVYANTSKGVYCVNCHNERMARSRKHHEDRKRRAKERAERKAKQEREKMSPGLVDRDKSLPAPPPELSPNPSIGSNTLSPVPPPVNTANCRFLYQRRLLKVIYWASESMALQNKNFVQREVNAVQQ